MKITDYIVTEDNILHMEYKKTVDEKTYTGTFDIENTDAIQTEADMVAYIESQIEIPPPE